MVYDIEKNVISDVTTQMIVVDNYGLVGDGETDNLETFNTLYAQYSGRTFVFADGTYCFSGTITLDSTHIILYNATLKFTADCDYGIKARGTQDTAHEHPEASEFITGHGGVIDCNKHAKIGVGIGTGKMFEVANLRICNVPESGTGLYHGITDRAGMCYELNAHDLLIENYEMLDNTVGIRMADDSMYSNIVTTNMKTGILVQGGLNTLKNYHPWNYDFQHLEGNMLADTYAIKLQSSILFLSDSYFDTVETGVLASSSNYRLNVTNLYWFNNTGSGTYAKTPVMFSGFDTGANLSIINGRFNPATTSNFSDTAFTAGTFVGCSYNSKVNNTPTV